jgi:hypothetical protein
MNVVSFNKLIEKIDSPFCGKYNLRNQLDALRKRSSEFSYVVTWPYAKKQYLAVSNMPLCEEDGNSSKHILDNILEYRYLKFYFEFSSLDPIYDLFGISSEEQVFIKLSGEKNIFVGKLIHDEL